MMLIETVSAKTKRLFKLFGLLPPMVICATVLIHATDVLGNDTIARIGAGGITFEKSEDIRMLEEVLEISLKKIRVNYRFLNESDHDIHTTVAFPLPSRENRLYEDPQPSQQAFVRTFQALVDGRSVSATALRDNAVYWQQSFPAGQEVVVEHTYAPMPGASYTSGGFGAGIASRIMNRVLINLFGVLPSPETGDSVCLDRSTRRAIENQVLTCMDQGNTVYVFRRDIEYILGTGRNWKGPIGTFILRIETEPPDQFMSVCFPGEPKKTSPSVTEFVQTDFVPHDKLLVYFYTVEPR